MAPPVVSVLVPVRDEAPHLADALASLSAQTFAEFEAIVVDDGSRDASYEIAAAHAAHDARFRVLGQEALGIVAALEHARREARGEVLARMDGDDVAMPSRLEAQLDALDADGLDACGGRIEYFPRASLRDGLRRYEAWINGLTTVAAATRDLFVECPLPHPALVVRREALERAGGYRDCGWPEDYDLVLRLWRGGARFRNVDATVLRWREHGERASRVEERYSLDAFVRCKVHHLRSTLLHGRDAVVWGAGPVGKSFARELLRTGTRVVAFVDVDPRKIGHDVYGIPVVAVGDERRFADAVALGAVAGEEGRRRVRELAAAAARVEGVDFVAVA